LKSEYPDQKAQNNIEGAIVGTKISIISRDFKGYEDKYDRRINYLKNEFLPKHLKYKDLINQAIEDIKKIKNTPFASQPPKKMEPWQLQDITKAGKRRAKDQRPRKEQSTLARDATARELTISEAAAGAQPDIGVILKNQGKNLAAIQNIRRGETRPIGRPYQGPSEPEPLFQSKK